MLKNIEQNNQIQKIDTMEEKKIRQKPSNRPKLSEFKKESRYFISVGNLEYESEEEDWGDLLESEDEEEEQDLENLLEPFEDSEDELEDEESSEEERINYEEMEEENQDIFQFSSEEF